MRLAVPEADKEDKGVKQPKLEKVGVPTFEVSPPVLHTKLQQRQVTPPQVCGPATEQLQDALERLSISPTGG